MIGEKNIICWTWSDLIYQGVLVVLYWIGTSDKRINIGFSEWWADDLSNAKINFIVEKWQGRHIEFVGGVLCNTCFQFRACL